MSAPRAGPRSLRRDVALGLGTGVVLLWLLGLVGAWAMLRHEITEIYDAALARTADRILQLPPADEATSQPYLTGSEEMSYLFREADGTLLLRSPAADPAIFGPRPVPGFRDHADHRILARSLADGSYLEVADPLAERREATLDTLKTMLLPALLLVPLIFFGVGRVVTTRLRPIDDLAAQVALRDSDDLRPLATAGLQAELLPIEDAINRLMGRLADAMAAERTFSANAAHELRTPIAATLAHTQRLVAEASDGPLRTRALTIEAELRRMIRLSAKLLELSRAEAAGVVGGSGQDLRPVLRLVIAEFSCANLRLDLPAEPVRSVIDPDAFGILARNLVENALVHGTPPVDVILSARGVLTVSNGGPLLDPDALARMAHRFERLGSRRAGSGLGLAIVLTLVRTAGATLDLRSPADGRTGGLTAVVALPPTRGSATA